MRYGDRISKFMSRIGTGDRIFIVLSDKYLKSAYCMHELFDVWRNCREDDAEFVARTARLQAALRHDQNADATAPNTSIYWQEEFNKKQRAHREARPVRAFRRGERRVPLHDAICE